MSVCSVGQTWYEKHSIIHLCLESVHRDRQWLGSKTLLGRFPSHHLFSPCLLCHTLSLTFLASLSHFYRFVASPTGKLYTLECLKSAPPWAMLLLVSVKDYDVCNLTLPLNPVHSPLLSLPSLWFLWHCLLQSFLSIFFPSLTSTVEAAAQEETSDLRGFSHQRLMVCREGFWEQTERQLCKWEWQQM